MIFVIFCCPGIGQYCLLLLIIQNNTQTKSLFVLGIADREKATVSSPPKIIFCVTEPAPSHSALLKGIPNEPLHQPLDSQVLFGRGHGVGVFLNDKEASREHMKLLIQTNPVTGENVFVVETVSSTKPVFINGNPLKQQAGVTVLNTNDRLKIGQLEFTVTIIPGDSVESYQVEFTRSTVNPQQSNMKAENAPQLRVGVNTAEQIFMANQVQLGAVFLPNNVGVPANPAVNMNISANGGVSQFGPMVAAPYYGMPMAPTYQPMNSGMGHPTFQPMPAGMGQSFFQPQPTHPTFKSSPCSEPQQESLPPGVYCPSLNKYGHAPAQERRQMFHAKQPSEQSESFKETGPDGDSHISIQEIGQQKNCMTM